jgi:hypothetical protein
VISRIALATCLDMPTGDGDELPLPPALAERGVEATMVAWDQPGVDWSAFDLTVIRATWNYTLRYEEFRSWIAAVPRLHNPASVVLPNTDKAYLSALADAGLPVVPTQLVPPGTEPKLPEYGEFVLKPSLGAGSRGAGRFDAGLPDAHRLALDHVQRLHEAGRTVLVQPYLDAVDTAGETALIYFDGVFSHAICKGAMLEPDARHGVDADALYLQERIAARQPSEDELAVAGRVLRHVHAGLDEPLLYARIDLLPTPDGPVLVELELVEPSLFLSYSDGATERLADAISSRLRR